jgi:pre-mRNA-processing factor 6
MEPAATRMAKSMDAARQVKDDSSIFIAIGKIFWVEKKYTKARKFFQQAVHLNKDNGDAWLYLYHFEKETGNISVIDQLKEDFEEADPRHGANYWEPGVKSVANWKFSLVEMLDRIKPQQLKY